MGQIGHTIFAGGGGWGWGAEGLGKGCVKITLLVSCLQWLTCSFVFIMVEFEKVFYSPDLKMVLIFFVTKVSQKVLCSNEMLCYAMVNDKPGGLSECSHPLPQEIW